MSTSNIKLSVFTKPWRTLSIPELGMKIRKLGVDGIEFPLRSGYQLEPKDAEKGLPILVSQLSEYGLDIFSVASDLDEHVFAGCAAAGIPLIRTMPSISRGVGYMESERRERAKLEQALVFSKQYRVKIGVQQHYGDFVTDSMGLRHLLDGLDPEYIGGIWDAAHDGLAGQQPEYGLDIVWDQLAMVNLKNAYYQRTNGPEAEEAKWERYFTLGKHGLASWPRVAAYLKQRDYQGVVTLSAEYSDEERVDELIQEDVLYARMLFHR
jgi:sugar phosphate isomerase/epimerase